MMSDPPTAQSTFDEFMKGSIAPCFKEPGFRKRAGSFFREVPTCVQVVNYQKSSYSDRHDIRFTINVGVASKRLWAFFNGGKTIPASFPEYKCHVRRRIGDLLGSGDKWWRLAPHSEVDSLREEHQAAIGATIIPWLDRYGSDRGLVDLILGGDYPPRGIPLDEAVLLHTPETLSDFEVREGGYRKLAETNGRMAWALERLDEDRATWR
jgi:hypothetical protein